MRRHPDDFWQAHPDPDPLTVGVYDYIGEYRRARKRRDLWLVFLAGCVLGLIVGLGILIFAVVA